MLSVAEVMLLVQMLLLFVYFASTLRSKKDFRLIAMMIAAALFFESLVMIAVEVTGGGFSVLGVTTTSEVGVQNLVRTGGTVGTANIAGSYVALSLAPTIALALADVDTRLRRFATVAACTGVIALILTFSRAGWTSFVLSMVFLLGFAARRTRLRPRLVATIVVVGVLLVAPFIAVVAARLEGNDAGAAKSRIALARLAGKVIEANPVTGVGANNFAVVIPDYAGPEFTHEWLFTVHNKYLLVWAEAGIAALLAFVFFLFRTVQMGLRVARESDSLYSWLALGLATAIAGQALGDMLVDAFHTRPQVELLFVEAGIIAALYARHRDGEAGGRAAESGSP
jgi:O-antigen ligase